MATPSIDFGDILSEIGAAATPPHTSTPPVPSTGLISLSNPVGTFDAVSVLSGGVIIWNHRKQGNKEKKERIHLIEGDEGRWLMPLSHGGQRQYHLY